jgi:lysozyme
LAPERAFLARDLKMLSSELERKATMSRKIANRKGQTGAAKSEYIIMVLMIAVTTIAAVSLFGDNIRALFGSADNALAGDEGGSPNTKMARSLFRSSAAVSSSSGAGSPGAGSSFATGKSAISASGSSSRAGASSSNSSNHNAKLGGQAQAMGGVAAADSKAGSRGGEAGSKSLRAASKAPAPQAASASRSAESSAAKTVAAEAKAATAGSSKATGPAGTGEKGRPNAGARVSDEGLRHLMRTEGFRNKAYKDVAGYPTIGVGHLLTSQEKRTGTIMINGKAVSYKNGLTDEQVKDLLAQDVKKYEKVVIDSVKVPLTQGQFDALVSFSYNVGPNAFKKSNLLRVLNQGKYNQVPNEMRKWVKAGGRVVKGLKNRREAEIALWNRGSSRTLVATKD